MDINNLKQGEIYFLRQCELLHTMVKIINIREINHNEENYQEIDFEILELTHKPIIFNYKVGSNYRLFFEKKEKSKWQRIKEKIDDIWRIIKYDFKDDICEHFNKWDIYKVPPTYGQANRTEFWKQRNNIV